MFRYFAAKHKREAGLVPEGTTSQELLAQVARPITAEDIEMLYGAGPSTLEDVAKKLVQRINENETDHPSNPER